MIKYSDVEKAKMLDRICAQPGCWHYQARGYIYCICCLHGYCSSPAEEIKEMLIQYRLEHNA